MSVLGLPANQNGCPSITGTSRGAAYQWNGRTVWGPVAARIRAEASGDWDDSIAVERFKSRGGFLIHGKGRLIGHRSVAVGEQTFQARRGIVIATGSKPAIPPTPGLSEVNYWTKHDLIQKKELPESLTILGGGAVGCEFGQALSRFGVKVTIVEGGTRLLPAEEPEASAAVKEAFRAEGILVQTGSTVHSVWEQDQLIGMTLVNGHKIVSERLLIATGRKVDVENLGLESIGLQPIGPYVPVDDHLCVADGIWAMGDVTGIGMFTHVALYQSAIIAANILGKDHPPARYDAIPRVTFTDPEVGSVGFTEAEALANGFNGLAVTKQIPATFRGWLHAAGSGMIKLIVDRDTGKLIGGSTASPYGGELLGLLGFAIHTGAKLADLRNMIYAFPTFTGAIGEAVGAFGRGLATVIDPSYRGFEYLDTIRRSTLVKPTG